MLLSIKTGLKCIELYLLSNKTEFSFLKLLDVCKVIILVSSGIWDRAFKNGAICERQTLKNLKGIPLGPFLNTLYHLILISNCSKCRISLPEVFYEKGVFRHIANHLCRSLFFSKF